MKSKNVYIIAGSNGSGKTTFANKFLPNYAKCNNFVNSDLIAQGLSPFSPQTVAMKAGRLVLEQMQELVSKGCDFAFETTLSGKTYISFLKYLKKKDYSVYIFFLWMPTPELALARIKDRVADGGHDVPVNDVKRRFYRGIQNFFKFYKPLADSWLLFDNSEAVPNLVAKERHGELEISNKDLFEKIKTMAG